MTAHNVSICIHVWFVDDKLCAVIDRAYSGKLQSFRGYMSLQGREIILAGGSGGIGSSVAEQLRGEGARLVVSYLHNRERAERFAPAASILQADLSDSESRDRLLKAAPAMYGLVVFAGDPARGLDANAAMQRSHAANYMGPILLAREAA